MKIVDKKRLHLRKFPTYVYVNGEDRGRGLFMTEEEREYELASIDAEERMQKIMSDVSLALLIGFTLFCIAFRICF